MHFMGLNCISPFRIIIFAIVLISSQPILSSQIFPIAKHRCNDSCGNVSIPFPFGMSEHCYLNDAFFINCSSSENGPLPLLGNIPVRNISLEGQVQVWLRIKRTCYDRNRTEDIQKSQHQSLSLADLPTVISSTANILVAVGCDTRTMIKGLRRTHQDKLYSGCMSFCYGMEDVDDSCSGSGCCKVSIPRGIGELDITLGSYYNHSQVKGFNPCSYAFVIEESAWNSSSETRFLPFVDDQDLLFKNLSRNLTHSLMWIEKAIRSPVTLDWSIGNETCEEAKKNQTSYACKEHSTCVGRPKREGLGYRCQCDPGYEGNPYLPGGCQAVDGCKNSPCGEHSTCVKTSPGNHTCPCNKGFHLDKKGGKGCIPKSWNRDWIIPGISISLGFIFLASCYLYFELKRRKLIRMREEFFKKNGGLQFQQLLAGKEGSSKTARIFTAEELKEATNNFDESRIVGQGGYGIVYKGFLLDGSTVAIKKSKILDRNQIDQFINEVAVVSQINHRNVVQLLGCCLDIEVPLLVYEFINNGTLYEHIHDERKSSNLSWGTRLRIAAETAGVLSYLHSAAYPPIIHRDVKSANVLLDDKYNAKVSDFGASRLVPLDENRLATMVQGTIGYLDPEYLQTSQLTEKSDVYSFGVVLVELLTGKKVVSNDRHVEERNLAQYFLSSLKVDGLIQILDYNIVHDSNIQQLKEVAMLAKRCLNVKGEDRPLMKEVAMELEGFMGGMLQYFHVPFEVESAENRAFVEPKSDTFVAGESCSLVVESGSIQIDMLSGANEGR